MKINKKEKNLVDDTKKHKLSIETKNINNRNYINSISSNNSNIINTSRSNNCIIRRKWTF